MGRCMICGQRSEGISDALGLCAGCVVGDTGEARVQATEAHRRVRGDFGLPPEPPRSAGGTYCPRCVNTCRIADREVGYCGVRRNQDGRITGGDADSAAVQFDGATSSTEAGTYEVKVDYDAVGTITAAWMRQTGETEWRTAAVDGNQITGGTGDPEQGLQVTFVWPGDGPTSVTAEVRVQQGFGGALYDEMEAILDELDGPLAIKKQGYDNAIDQLERRIEQQEDRLVAMEERLRERYARLEGVLAQLDSFRGAFESLMTSLESMTGRRQSS